MVEYLWKGVEKWQAERLFDKLEDAGIRPLWEGWVSDNREDGTDADYRLRRVNGEFRHGKLNDQLEWAERHKAGKIKITFYEGYWRYVIYMRIKVDNQFELVENILEGIG